MAAPRALAMLSSRPSMASKTRFPRTAPLLSTGPFASVSQSPVSRPSSTLPLAQTNQPACFYSQRRIRLWTQRCRGSFAVEARWPPSLERWPLARTSSRGRPAWLWARILHRRRQQRFRLDGDRCRRTKWLWLSLHAFNASSRSDACSSHPTGRRACRIT